MSYIVLFIIIFIFLLAVVVFFMNARRKGITANEQQYIYSHWTNVLAETNKNPGKAILDADKLLSYALNKNGFEGSVGEKLKKAGSRFTNLNAVWRAHKLRNRVAHELGKISVAEAKDALKHFRRALNDLGAKL